MRSGHRARGSAGRVLLATVALALAACSHGGPSAAERSRATTLPTPSSAGPDVRQFLAGRLRTLLDSTNVSVNEDLVVDGDETEVRLGWRAGGSVVDASIQPIVSSTPATEVFRSPSELLSRPTGQGAACWSQAGPSLDRFDRPLAQELAVLRSARAVAGQDALISGSVSALAALRIVGTDDELRSRNLLPPAGVQVAATFGTTGGGLLITITWSDLVAAAGNSSSHSRQGTWMLRFQTVGTGGPAAPPAHEVVSVPPSDPSYASAVQACNARIQ